LLPVAGHILIISAQEDINDLTVLVFCCERIPSSKRMRMAEYLSRATLNLKIGSFRFDLQDGEIVFRISMDIKHCNRDDILALLAEFVEVSESTWKKFLPSIKTILSDDSANIDTLVKSVIECDH
jgi:hypothetical protein